MKVLVTGGSGLLGRAVLKAFKEGGHEVTGTAFSRVKNGLLKLDLESTEEVMTLCIIGCAKFYILRATSNCRYIVLFWKYNPM